MLDNRTVPRLVVLSRWEDDLPSRLLFLFVAGLASHMITVEGSEGRPFQHHGFF